MPELTLILRRYLADVGSLVAHADIVDDERVRVIIARNAWILDNEHASGRQNVALLALKLPIHCLSQLLVLQTITFDSTAKFIVI